MFSDVQVEHIKRIGRKAIILLYLTGEARPLRASLISRRLEIDYHTARG